MASLNQYATIILDKLGLPFDDGIKEDIKFTFRTYRAVMARRDIERNSLSPLYLQFIVLPLVKTDKIDSCLIATGCEILITKDKVPVPIRLKSGDLFKYVGTADRVSKESKAFGYVEMEGFINSTYNKYTGGNVKYSWQNGRLPILGNHKYKFVGIEGVFEDPSSVPNCGEVCYTDDDDFPVPMDIAQTIIQSMENGEYKIIKKSNQVETEPD